MVAVVPRTSATKGLPLAAATFPAVEPHPAAGSASPAATRAADARIHVMHGFYPVRSAGLRLQLADLEDLRPAVGARALDCRATVLLGHLHRVHDLDLLLFLDAITLGHSATSSVGVCA